MFKEAHRELDPSARTEGPAPELSDSRSVLEGGSLLVLGGRVLARGWQSCWIQQPLACWMHGMYVGYMWKDICRTACQVMCATEQ